MSQVQVPWFTNSSGSTDAPPFSQRSGCAAPTFTLTGAAKTTAESTIHVIIVASHELSALAS